MRVLRSWRKILRPRSSQDEWARRLTGIKGVGPLIASAAACLLQAGGHGGEWPKLQEWAPLCGQSGAGAQRALQWRPPTAGEGLPNGVTGICAACSSRGPGRSCAMPTAVKTGCHVGPDRSPACCRQVARIGKHKAAVAVANKPCLLQAGGPHHLVDAVSRHRVPAGLRHAQASLRQGVERNCIVPQCAEVD